MMAAREFAMYKLDLVGVLRVRWGRGGTEPAGDHTFLYGNGNKNNELGTGFFVYMRIILAVKRAEFVSDGKSYIKLRDCWCNIILEDTTNNTAPMRNLNVYSIS
jgi:hypothetical protein